MIPGLLDRLLAGPAEPGLCSPFPEDLVLRSWTLENSQLRLDFSEAYEGLSGVDLTLANCCLALTLCQAEGVETVYITVEGGSVLWPQDLCGRRMRSSAGRRDVR